MARGPQVERLHNAVTGAEPAPVGTGANEWRRCGAVLQTISMYLQNASPGVREAIGGETGPAVDAAFQQSAKAMLAKAALLGDGGGALGAVSQAMQTATEEYAKLTAAEPTEPAAYRAPVGNPTDEELQQQAQSKAKEQAFAQALAAQEEKARAAADALDEAFEKQTQTMKEIHGEPDPPPPPPPPSGQPGSAGGTSGSAGSGGAAAVPHLRGQAGIGVVDHGFAQVHPGPHVGYVPAGGGHDGNGYLPGTGSTGDPTAPVEGAVPGSTGGLGGPGGSSIGTAGATAGGMAAGLLGAKLTGALKGGLFPTSGGTAGTAGTTGRGTAASAVRGIGSSARTGGAGTIGRSGAAAGSGGTAGRAGVGGAGGAGRSGSGAGAGRSGSGGRAGSGSGARAGAGGRSGAGTGAGGRSGRGKDDEKGRKKELFDVGEDWVDDEGAAPGVID